MGLGWTEITIILVIALVIFGPRKLPELGKGLGQALSQFRKASNELTTRWSEEVEMENDRLAALPPPPADPARAAGTPAARAEEREAGG